MDCVRNREKAKILTYQGTLKVCGITSKEAAKVRGIISLTEKMCDLTVTEFYLQILIRFFVTEKFIIKITM